MIQQININPKHNSLLGKLNPNATIVMVLCDATAEAFSIRLPNATGLRHRQMFVFKKTDASANAVTGNTQFRQTIDGAISFTLSSQYDTIAFISDYSNFQKIFSI